MSGSLQSNGSEFARSTVLRRIDDRVWESDFSADWCIGKVPNGGYTLALGAKVLGEALPHSDPLNVTAYYLALNQSIPKLKVRGMWHINTVVIIGHVGNTLLRQSLTMEIFNMLKDTNQLYFYLSVLNQLDHSVGR